MSGSVIDAAKGNGTDSPDNSTDTTQSPTPVILAPVILAIDTSSHHGSIALIRGRHPLAIYGADSRDTHSTRLITEIDMVLTKAGIKLEEVDALAVVTGPGSFTGLRIGLSTIKGLARAIDKPVVGVTTLEATALSAGAGENVLAFVNALRNEVYAQLFRVGPDGAVPASKAIVASAETVLEQFAQPSLVLAGDGVAVYRESIELRAASKGYAVRESLVGGVSDAEGWIIALDMPFLAFETARIAVNWVLNREVSNPQEIDAFYVRQSDAELKLGVKSK
jgi:tRNA threonylcarbamoyladenosine biosynthesis protein TsaB